jgi:hypothetical protein
MMPTDCSESWNLQRPNETTKKKPSRPSAEDVLTKSQK